MTIDRVWLVIGFIEHLQIVTTRAIANSHTLQFTTARIKSSQPAVSSPVDISPAPRLTSSQAGGHLTRTSHSPNCRLKSLLVKAKVTLRLAVYSQSVRLGRQAPWDPRPEILFGNWTLGVIVPMQHLLRREDGVVSLWICLAFVQCTYRTYGMLLEILPFALHTSSVSMGFAESESESGSRSEALHDWRFITDQFVLAPKANGPRYTASSRTAERTSLPTLLPLLCACLLRPLFRNGNCLEQLLSNSYFISAYFTVVAYQRVYMPHAHISVDCKNNNMASVQNLSLAFRFNAITNYAYKMWCRDTPCTCLHIMYAILLRQYDKYGDDAKL
jgi:hypothetical protein